MARKHVEDHIINFMTEITQGDTSNAKRYKKFFKTLSDTKFKEWVADIADLTKPETKLFIVAPRNGDVKLSMEDIIRIGDKYGVPVDRDIIVTHPDGNEQILPHKVIVLKLPVRRASQVISVQMKAAKHDKNIDALTGQATGDSASGAMSLPEADILASYGFEKGLEELISVNGGDVGAYAGYKRSLSTDGTVKLSDLKYDKTGVKSKQTLASMLRVQYIGTNI